MAKRRYNLFDNGSLILENATPKEMRNHLGIKLPNSLAPYIEKGHKIKGRYTITYSGMENEPLSQDQDFIEEWRRAVAPFKNVVWVKDGGRKLKIGGKT